jgi:hypothetical protein
MPGHIPHARNLGTMCAHGMRDTERKNMGDRDGQQVYAKTDKGRDEIAMRTSGLSFRLRALLLLVDGQRTVSTLADSFGNDAGTTERLAQLAAGGFIAVRIAPVAIPASPPVPPPSAPLPAAATSSSAPAPAFSLHDIYSSRR